MEFNGVGIKSTKDLIEAIKLGSPGDLEHIFSAFEYRYNKDQAFDEIEAVIYYLLNKEWCSRKYRPYAFCAEYQEKFETPESWKDHCLNGKCV